MDRKIIWEDGGKDLPDDEILRNLVQFLEDGRADGQDWMGEMEAGNTIVRLDGDTRFWEVLKISKRGRLEKAPLD